MQFQINFCLCNLIGGLYSLNSTLRSSLPSPAHLVQFNPQHEVPGLSNLVQVNSRGCGEPQCDGAWCGGLEPAIFLLTCVQRRVLLRRGRGTLQQVV